MTRHHDPNRPPRVREPVQVYLQSADRERLERLAERLGATKSDVLRRGLAALDAQTAASSDAAGRGPPLPTFSGLGLQPGVDLDDSASLLDLMDGADTTATD